MSRRRFLHASLPGAVLLVQQGKPAGDSAVKGQGTGARADTLAEPWIVGRRAAPLNSYDTDPGVIAIERKLRCTCGCTLDVYTCRTTDFSCTYSPAMHQDVVARVTRGETPDQIIASFVSREGESVLMAPPASGFNLAGYLVPGLAVAAAALLILAWLGRRRAEVQAVPTLATPPQAPDRTELERLQRALDEVDS